ncbi:phenylalanine ammonia-lyase, partial [Sodiomyces alkalinus F11]
KLQGLKVRGASLDIDGCSLDIPSVVAAAWHGLAPNIKADPLLRRRLQDSIRVLNRHLENGWIIYGVNTGFGGSADSRTEQLNKLQVALLQHTQSAIITSDDKAGRTDRDGQSHVIPVSWVKAAILIRANQNLRGHSAVRLEVIDKLLQLLYHDITPLVPLRGTISASGDLMPLSYIAGTLTGNPDIFVRLGSDSDSDSHATGHRIVSSQVALETKGLTPVELGPKEGLGLINGTAPSAALAALVLHQAHQLALLAQSLTAFTAECLSGNVEWSNDFIQAIRPHPGQQEAARTIRALLGGSTFVVGLNGEDKRRTGDGLWQDRYSTRTAPQWIGPYLEDLLQARRQVELELNSTCDNPVIEADKNEVYSGGNFQATVITSAMDKTKSALVMIGRMLFAQCTELIDPALNNGLDANLVFGDPHDSYTMKGLDVNMAAYMSELAALAHPVSAHVLPAEMRNQSINSLAFLSARRTAEALDLLAHICAAHLYVCCQAVDLRHYHRRFLAHHVLHLALEPSSSPSSSLSSLGLSPETRASLCRDLRDLLVRRWHEANRIGHIERCKHVASDLASFILTTTVEQKEGIDPVTVAQAVISFQKTLHRDMQSWVTDPVNDPDPPPPSSSFATATATATATTTPGIKIPEGLGRGASELYRVVRGLLGVGFHRGLRGSSTIQDSGVGKTIGTDVSTIYEAIRDETVMDTLMP